MSDFDIVPERAESDPAVDALHATSFGPGRFARAAFRLREQGPHDRGLSFLAFEKSDGSLCGSVRQTRIDTGPGTVPGLLLGPLAVVAPSQRRGIGRALMAAAVAAAQADGEARFILLVGDAPYYAPFGFVPVRPGTVSLPGPVEAHRLLVHPLGDAAQASALAGRVRVRP